MKKFFKSLLLVLLGGALGYYIASEYTYSTIIVEGMSMEPSYHEGDMAIVNHLQLKLRSPSRNEVVVVVFEDKVRAIKRVIGLPGDRIDGITLGSDEYWILGDNREVSYDSSEVGPFNRKQILGVVER